MINQLPWKQKVLAAIMHTNWDIRYSISTSGYSPPSLISHSMTSDSTKVRPTYPTCNFRNKYFQMHVRHFYFRLNADRILHKATSSGDFGILKKQTQSTQHRWIGSHWWFTPFDLMVTKWSPFHQEIIHPHLHFRWRHSIMERTISKISISSFHPALMALGIHRSALENFNRPLR